MHLLAWNLGGQEMFFILLIVLLLFGAKKLPELARGLGSSVKEFKKAKDEFDTELRKTTDDLKIEEPVGKLPARTPMTTATTEPAEVSPPKSLT